MLTRTLILSIAGFICASLALSGSPKIVAGNSMYESLTEDHPSTINFESSFSSTLFLTPQDTATNNDTTESENSEASEKKEKGFIKKLFSSATKAEKAAKKEAKSLKHIEKKETRIYGWHPYWMTDASEGYEYNLLTTLSYFSIDANYNSDDTSIKYQDNEIGSGKARNLFNRASRAGCRLDVTFKCQEKEAVYLLLNNETVRDSCIRYIVHKLDNNYKYDGVCVVFENIPPGNSASLLTFMANLRAALKSTKQTLKLALPAKDFSKNFDILKLNKVVDEYVMMGYNYHHKGSKEGPVSPLDSPRKFHVKASVDEYLKNGVPFNKFIVALPYFGIVWKTDDHKKEGYKFYEHWSYSQIQKHLASSNAIVKYDSKTSTYYYDFYDDNDSSVTYRCYFDNAETLAKKYKWVIKKGLAGVGIWALGYDNGSKDFWKMIDKNFKVVKLPPISRKIDIVNRIELKTDTVIHGDDTTIFTHKTILRDTIGDTLLKALIYGPADTATRVEEPPMLLRIIETLGDYFEPLLKNQKVITTIVIALIIFGLIGLLSSLLFESVRELMYILSIPGYILANIVVILSALALFGFVGWFNPEIKDLFPRNYALYICEIKKGIWILIVSAWLVINLLSHRLLGRFSFNHDKP